MKPGEGVMLLHTGIPPQASVRKNLQSSSFLGSVTVASHSTFSDAVSGRHNAATATDEHSNFTPGGHHYQTIMAALQFSFQAAYSRMGQHRSHYLAFPLSGSCSSSVHTGRYAAWSPMPGFSASCPNLQHTSQPLPATSVST